MLRVYYAWTFLQILNMTNLRANILNDGEAILYIAYYENTSSYKTIINNILKNDIFSDVKILDLRRRGTIINDLNNYDKVSELIIAGFWCDALFLVKMLVRQYKLKKISIIEEGTFIPNRKNLYQNLSIGKKIYGGGLNYKSYIKMVDTIYSYGIDNAEYENRFSYSVLPKISNNNICFNILRNNCISNKNYVSKYDVFYFDGNYNVIDKEVLQKFYKEIFRPFIKANKKISVRLHPSNQDRKSLFTNLDIDENKRTIEEMSVCGDWNGKIIISICSSAALNLHRIFDCNVKIIYLSKLYPEKPKFKIADVELFDGDCRPESLKEYRELCERAIH